MNASLRRAAAVVAVATSLAAASPADAMTLEIGTPTLSARVMLTVPVTVVCEPFDPSLSFRQAFVSVSVKQAVNKRIAFGTGQYVSNAPDATPPCDGAPHVVNVVVLADTAGPPFKRGEAVVTASGAALAGIPCPHYPGCTTDPVQQRASLGPVAVRVR
jgi:hypothetical protein